MAADHFSPRQNDNDRTHQTVRQGGSRFSGSNRFMDKFASLNQLNEYDPTIKFETSGRKS